MLRIHTKKAMRSVINHKCKESRMNFVRCGFVEFRVFTSCLSARTIAARAIWLATISKLRKYGKSKSQMKRECQRAAPLHVTCSVGRYSGFNMRNTNTEYVIMQLWCECAIIVNEWKFSQHFSLHFCEMNYVPFWFMFISVNKDYRLFNNKSSYRNSYPSESEM